MATFTGLLVRVLAIDVMLRTQLESVNDNLIVLMKIETLVVLR